MADAVQPIRLVPRQQALANRVRSFACNGVDGLRVALASLASSGGPVLTSAGVLDLEESWLDTADKQLLRAGLILRARVEPGSTIARLTKFAGPWPSESDPDKIVQSMARDALQDSSFGAGPVGDRLRDLLGKRPLTRFVELTSQRSVFEGTIEASRIEIRVDEIRTERPVRLGQNPICLLTVAGNAAPERVDALVDSLRGPCALSPAPSFREAAQQLAGIEPVPDPDLGPEDTDPSMTASALAFVSLRRHTRAFLRSEPGARLGDDAEALHQMRVASRRLRAAFSLFAALLPKRGDALRREAVRVGSVLGAVRDLDVQLEQLAAWRKEETAEAGAAFDAIEAAIRLRRATARRRLIATFETVRYTRFVERLRAFLLRGPGHRPSLGRRPAKSQAPELIGRRYRAVRKIGDRLSRESPPHLLHALRIRAKRLRYALELHRPLYDGEVAVMIESLTALQDLLGEHQDAIVAIGHLEELASVGGRKLRPRTAFLMGTIAAKYAHRAEALRQAFPKTYRKIRGRRWRALKATLADGVP